MADNESVKDSSPIPEKPAERPGRSGTAHKIIRAGIVVAVAHILLKFISPVQYMFVGHLCDEVTRDLFIFAFESVLLMLFLVGEESLGPAFLPVFMQEKEQRGEAAAWRFTNTILTVQFMLIMIAVMVVALFPEAVVRLLTKWDDDGKNALYMQLGPLYARYVVLGLFGLSLGSTTYMLLNGYKRFFLAAFGDAAFKIGIVGALAASWAFHFKLSGESAVAIFAIGAVAGSLLKLALHLFGLRDKLTLLRPCFDIRGTAFRQFALLVAPLLIGIIFAKVRDIYNNVLVLSALEAGFMSATAFGRKIYQTIRFVGPYAVSIAMLPFFCEMVAKDQRTELGAMVTRTSRLALLMCAPLTTIVIALSLPITQMLFQGGKYTFEAAVQASVANSFYTLVLPFAALECIFMQTFFANRRMISVTVLGVFFSFLSMFISYWFVIRLGWRGLPAVAAVSLSFTLSRALKVITLGVLLRRVLPCFPAAETFSYFLRIFMIALVSGLSCYAVRHLYDSFVVVPAQASRLQVWVHVGPGLGLAGATGAIVFFAAACLLLRDDLNQIKVWLFARLRRT